MVWIGLLFSIMLRICLPCLVGPRALVDDPDRIASSCGVCCKHAFASSHGAGISDIALLSSVVQDHGHRLRMDRL